MCPDSTDDRPLRRLDAHLARSRRLLESRLEADLLAAHVLGRPRSWLMAHGETLLDPGTIERLDRLVEQRRQGRPVAQLVGSRAFYRFDFRVDEHVLIPRPETELLVELALGLALPDEARICDLGTGSGCIALTLAAERPRWAVAALDCSAEALAVAESNRRALELTNVEFVHGDLLEPVAGRRFDLIVSNPPYIPDSDPHLERGDLRFEPRGALAAGPDGLAVIRPLIENAGDSLADKGWLLIEHGHDQAGAVRELMTATGYRQIESHRDLAGIERVTMACSPP